MNSSVFKWPNRKKVDRAVRAWAAQEAKRVPEMVKMGYFGSYARGDWGVGSDLDLVAIVDRESRPFASRSSAWDLRDLPVPAQVIVYTSAE